MLGVAPDHTSFNHVRVCNHFVHFFGCIGDRSCYCANCERREGLTGGKSGRQLDLWVLRFVSFRFLHFSFMTKMF